jgi:hypothetical protein
MEAASSFHIVHPCGLKGLVAALGRLARRRTVWPQFLRLYLSCLANLGNNSRRSHVTFNALCHDIKDEDYGLARLFRADFADT